MGRSTADTLLLCQNYSTLQYLLEIILEKIEKVYLMGNRSLERSWELLSLRS
jgi:hypothetical protein